MALLLVGIVAIVMALVGLVVATSGMNETPEERRERFDSLPPL